MHVLDAQAFLSDCNESLGQETRWKLALPGALPWRLIGTQMLLHFILGTGICRIPTWEKHVAALRIFQDDSRLSS